MRKHILFKFYLIDFCNNIYRKNLECYNMLIMIYNFFKIAYIFLSEFISFKFKNIINKFKKLPNLERLYLIQNITYKLQDLNIVYVKVFQSLCLDKNILNDDEQEFLIQYTDRVPYNSDDINLKNLIIDRYKNIKYINTGDIGLGKTFPSSIPKRLTIEPVAIFLITTSIGIISNL